MFSPLLSLQASGEGSFLSSSDLLRRRQSQIKGVLAQVEEGGTRKENLVKYQRRSSERRGLIGQNECEVNLRK
jgi:hypothetical protein